MLQIPGFALVSRPWARSAPLGSGKEAAYTIEGQTAAVGLIPPPTPFDGKAPAGSSGSWISPIPRRVMIQPFSLAFVRPEQQQTLLTSQDMQGYGQDFLWICRLCGASWDPFHVSVVLPVTPRLQGKSSGLSSKSLFSGWPQAS